MSTIAASPQKLNSMSLLPICLTVFLLVFVAVATGLGIGIGKRDRKICACKTTCPKCPISTLCPSCIQCPTPPVPQTVTVKLSLNKSNVSNSLVLADTIRSMKTATISLDAIAQDEQNFYISPQNKMRAFAHVMIDAQQYSSFFSDDNFVTAREIPNTFQSNFGIIQYVDYSSTRIIGVDSAAVNYVGWININDDYPVWTIVEKKYIDLLSKAHQVAFNAISNTWVVTGKPALATTNNAIMYSQDDGNTWTLATVPVDTGTNPTILCFKTFDQGFVAHCSGGVGAKSPQAMLTSTDGKVWTILPIPPASQMDTVTDMVYLGGPTRRWAMAGSNAAAGRVVFVSNDFKDWVAPIALETSVVQCIATDGVGGLAVGGVGPQKTIGFSKDEFKTSTYNSMMVKEVYGMLFDGVNFVAWGGTNQTMMTSPDGITWTAKTFPASMRLQQGKSVITRYINTSMRTRDRLLVAKGKSISLDYILPASSYDYLAKGSAITLRCDGVNSSGAATATLTLKL